MNLRNKHALVTGGAVRIGRAICEALAREGAHVLVHHRQSHRAAEALCQRLRAAGGRADAVYADLAAPAGAGQLMAACRAYCRRVDLLVNNAAVFEKLPLLNTGDSQLRELMAVNLLAPLELMRLFAAQGGRGRIVNLLDRRITAWDATSTVYSITKKALADATRLAALEFAPAITVNAVAPGAILPPRGARHRRMKELAGPMPLRRAATARDVAAAVVYLLKNNVMTGQVLFIDSGQHLLGAGPQ